MLLPLLDYQYEIVRGNAQDQLIILPRLAGKTHLILEKINYRTDYRQVGVVLPTRIMLERFISNAHRFFKVSFLRNYMYSRIFEFENVDGEKIVVCVINAGEPINMTFDLYLDCLFIDEGDYVDSNILGQFLAYKDLYVTGSLRFSSPQLNTCMGYLYYNHLEGEEFKMYRSNITLFSYLK